VATLLLYSGVGELGSVALRPALADGLLFSTIKLIDSFGLKFSSTYGTNPHFFKRVQQFQ
jgi:hypothetical protein